MVHSFSLPVTGSISFYLVLPLLACSAAAIAAFDFIWEEAGGFYYTTPS
jgi:hypothetical protein